MKALAIQARHLCAAYGATLALDGLDATVEAGEILVLLGENGSGKSTFLKLVARILPPSGGELLLDGRALD
ncbi:MAG: ATP-binding cassette domain-containing protein, partial [Thermoanaerobaculia bacterium]